MLPIHEIDTLLTTITDAVDPAAEGDAAGAYEVLLTGLHRVRELQEDDQDWGAKLVEQWQKAVDRYTQRQRPGRA